MHLLLTSAVAVSLGCAQGLADSNAPMAFVWGVDLIVQLLWIAACASVSFFTLSVYETIPFNMLRFASLALVILYWLGEFGMSIRPSGISYRTWTGAMVIAIWAIAAYALAAKTRSRSSAAREERWLQTFLVASVIAMPIVHLLV